MLTRTTFQNDNASPAIPKTVSRRFLTYGLGFIPRNLHVKLVVDKVAGQGSGLSLSTSDFSCQYHSTSASYPLSMFVLQHSIRFVSLKRTFWTAKIHLLGVVFCLWLSECLLWKRRRMCNGWGNAKRPCLKQSLRCPLRAIMLTYLPSSAILLWIRSYVMSVASDATEIRKFRNILNFFNAGKHNFTGSVIKIRHWTSI